MKNFLCFKETYDILFSQSFRRFLKPLFRPFPYSISPLLFIISSSYHIFHSWIPSIDMASSIITPSCLFLIPLSSLPTSCPFISFISSSIRLLSSTSAWCTFLVSQTDWQPIFDVKTLSWLTKNSLLSSTPGFSFTQRSRECLPKGFPSDIEGTPYFLDDYKHPKVTDPTAHLFDHITAALKELGITIVPPDNPPPPDDHHDVKATSSNSETSGCPFAAAFSSSTRSPSSKTLTLDLSPTYDIGGGNGDHSPAI